MTDFKKLEIQALEEFMEYLEQKVQLEPLQRYVEEKLNEAGDDQKERMSVMMELIRFNLYLELLPEYRTLRDYVQTIESGQVQEGDAETECPPETFKKAA